MIFLILVPEFNGCLGLNEDPALSILDLGLRLDQGESVATCSDAEALGGRWFEVNYYDGNYTLNAEIPAVNITVHVYGCCSEDDCKAPGADTADSKYTCTIRHFSAYKITYMTYAGRVQGKTSLEHGP